MEIINKNKLESVVTNKEFLVYTYVTVSLILLLLRNGLGFSVPVSVFLVISALPIIFGNDDCLVAYAVTCIPFSAGFQFKYGLLLCVFVYMIKHHGKIKFTKATAMVFLLLAWEFFHAFWGTFSVIQYFRGMSQFLFLIILFSMDREKFNSKLILRSLAISVVGVCAIILFIQLRRYGFNILSAFAGDGFSLYRFGKGNIDAENYGLNFNANNLGFICNVAIVGILFLFVRKESSRFDLLLLLASTLFGLLTLSRTFVICLIVNVFLFIVTQSNDYKSIIKALALVILLGVLIYYSVERFLPQVFTNIVNRFQETDITNGRDYILTFYFNHIFSSFIYFLFGIGLQDYYGKIKNIYGENINVPHNGIQEIWVVWGIIGVIIIILLIYFIIKESKQGNEKRFIYQYIPLIHLIIDTSMGQFLNDRPQLTLIIVYICLCASNKFLKE